MSFFKKLFARRKKEEEQQEELEFTQEQWDADYEFKRQGLENVLGEMHRIVGHAIIPFAVGGAVDMYYFPNHIAGTGFATMELLDPNGNGPLPNRLGTYELVAFTKQSINENDDETTAFNLIERRICGTFTTIANYCSQAVLNPLETCEVPGSEGEYRCVVFDNYLPGNKAFQVGDRKHHLLLCLEVFRSEMEYARQHGSEELLHLLKQKGYYPYSDLDREPVA
jgi:hypothetical protein